MVMFIHPDFKLLTTLNLAVELAVEVFSPNSAFPRMLWDTVSKVLLQ